MAESVVWFINGMAWGVVFCMTYDARQARRRAKRRMKELGGDDG